MNNTLKILLGTMGSLLVVVNVMAIEEAAYDVVKKDGRFEVRDYASHIVAETVVDGDLEEAGNNAFNTLFRYISGDNASQTKVAMTAPVAQEAAGEKIKMTAPVGQQQVQGRWAVSFMMPATYTMDTLPKPANSKVELREVPARRVVAVRYSGFWSEKNYRRFLAALESWMDEQGLTAAADPVWARYNAPFVPWFLRRNEILIPLGGN